MENNKEIYRYIQDEYIGTIAAKHELSQNQRKNIANELISLLNLTGKRYGASGKSKKHFWQLWQKSAQEDSKVQNQIYRKPEPLT